VDVHIQLLHRRMNGSDARAIARSIRLSRYPRGLPTSVDRLSARRGLRYDLFVVSCALRRRAS